MEGSVERLIPAPLSFRRKLESRRVVRGIVVEALNKSILDFSEHAR